ncbi:N-acetylmuramoyl-L-alanine amidase [Crenobacter intestini]|uniref:N-acetylmuramoyl-L-alanine amidase n=1 Tax=Crenobacter intestini TaxID=2563443 RepID=A0A4T0UWH8_9NEIS|nr:N-acetylmuramoyl-L-alanine amidase [Crenobacter intestini]TIC83201.1 N-acetylmuramoyl-L-alanine amidase [Crenobacter intestini]
MTYTATRQHVHNRGRAPIAFLDEIVAWGKVAPEEVFAPNSASDIYSSVKNILGPWQNNQHRRAVMLEVLRVLGGFESSWDWNEGRDESNPDSDTPVEIEAGIFQVSANSMNFGAELRELVQREAGSTDPVSFQRQMKANHHLAIEYCARLLRRTIRHHGPIRDGHIHNWLRRDAVEEFLDLLASDPSAVPSGVSISVTSEGSDLAPGETDRPSRANLESPGFVMAAAPAGDLWIPFAKKNEGGTMKTRGRYRRGYPEGAIVHFTAGRDNPINDISSGIKNGFAYLVIAPNGGLYQNHRLDEWGYHAGKSSWPPLGGGVSQYLLGIEICAAGKLHKIDDAHFRPWYNEEKYLKERGKTPKPEDDLLPHQVRFVPNEANRVEGWYEKYTDAQEATLKEVLKWLRHNRPDVFSYDLVLGHDEVSPGRKNDPGGALSITMPALRNWLKASG